jgi:hypothetical protein
MPARGMNHQMSANESLGDYNHFKLEFLVHALAHSEGSLKFAAHRTVRQEEVEFHLFILKQLPSASELVAKFQLLFYIFKTIPHK